MELAGFKSLIIRIKIVVQTGISWDMSGSMRACKDISDLKIIIREKGV